MIQRALGYLTKAIFEQQHVQTVLCNSLSSTVTWIDPQESIPDALFLIIYINYLIYCTEDFKVIIFGDESTLYGRDKSFSGLAVKLTLKYLRLLSGFKF